MIKLTEQENIDQLEWLVNLAITHWKRDLDKKPFSVICKEILKETGLPAATELRRAYDGYSHTDHLIEKMIAEIILGNDPKF